MLVTLIVPARLDLKMPHISLLDGLGQNSGTIVISDQLGT